MNRRSRTADLVALWRATEHRRRRRRIVVDPFAEPLLARLAPGWLGGGPSTLRARLIDLASRIAPTRIAQTVLLRHQLLDTWTVTGLEAGIDQVVLLGAGLDARAHRLLPGTAYAGTRVFEVDHPAFSEVKRRLVAELLPDAQAHVTYVAVDLGEHPLAPALEGAGFDPTRPAVFIWEGVTYYLKEAACDATLRAIGELAAPGSTLGLDLWSRPEAGARVGALADRITRWNLRLIGEPIHTRVPPGPEGGRAWLEARGLRLDTWFGPRKLREMLRGRPLRRIDHLALPPLAVAWCQVSDGGTVERLG